MSNTSNTSFPLGVAKQAVMKLDGANTDIHEMMEDDGLTHDQRDTLEAISEILASMMAGLVNMVKSEIGETDFLNENVVMDEIDEYPESTPEE